LKHYSLLLLLLTACNQVNHSLVIPIEFKPYVDSFVSEGYKQNTTVIVDNLVISFESEPPNQLGRCSVGPGQTPTIYINNISWYINSETNRKVTMFHELGHCVLFRVHTLTYVSPGVTTSIMYPDILDDNMYLNNWDYYMKEMFDHSKFGVL
jgi:hypothetical protein